MSIDVSGIKRGQRAMWAAGDYPDIAKHIDSAAGELATAVGAGPAKRLLDVATGSGNVAIHAARAGAEVTGLDLTPELLVVARERAAAEGFEIGFVEGDAEQLPFDADSFDVVTSCFGVMFAPLQQRAAGELVRVARPGGTVGVVAWTPDGLNGRMFRTIASYMPAPPPELSPPVMWGVEDHVRGLFEGSGAELSFERHSVSFEADSVEAWIDYNERVLGPSIMARAVLEPQDRYGELRAELVGLYSAANEATDGSMRAGAEYLMTIARLPA